MGAKAQFESNIVSNRSYDQQEAFYQQSSSGYHSSFISDIFSVIQDFIEGVIILSSIGLCIFAFFFFLYIIISLFKKGGETTLREIQGFGRWLGNIIGGTIAYLWKSFKQVFFFFWGRKSLSILLIIIFIGLQFTQSVINGNSRLLKLSKIAPGYVGVDLRNSKVISPGYHLYSPLRSGFFLSPTSNFSFDIIDVKAHSKEELAVTLDYRVTFKIADDDRLELYDSNGAKNIQLISSDIVMPQMLEVINGIIKDYSFKDISGSHSEIKTITIAGANSVLENIGITIEDLNILAIQLPESYIASKQDLLKAENELRLSQAKLDAQKKESEKKLLEAQNNKAVKIIEAEAVSEYNKIIANQELTPAMIEMKKLEIEEKKVEKWDGKLVGGEKFGM